MYVNNTAWSYASETFSFNLTMKTNMQKIFGKYCRGFVTVCGVVLPCQSFQMKYLKFIHDAHCSFCYYEYNTENWCTIVIMRNRKLKSSIPSVHCNDTMWIMFLMVNRMIWIIHFYYCYYYSLCSFTHKVFGIEYFLFAIHYQAWDSQSLSIEFFWIHVNCFKWMNK